MDPAEMENDETEEFLKNIKRHIGQVAVFLFGGGPPDGRDISECIGDCSYNYGCISRKCDTCPHNSKNGGECKLWKRIKIAAKLESIRDIGIVPIVFEIYFFNVYNQLRRSGLLDVFIDILEESEITDDLDRSLIVIIPESPGSISEYMYYSSKNETKHRVRLIVEEQYNPLYNKKISYLSSHYLNFSGETGHLYYVQNINDDETLAKLVTRIALADIKSRVRNRIVREDLNNSIEDINIGGNKNGSN